MEWMLTSEVLQVRNLVEREPEVMEGLSLCSPGQQSDSGLVFL